MLKNTQNPNTSKSRRPTSNKAESSRTVKRSEDPIWKANVGKIPKGVTKPMQMAKEKPIQMASKAQQMLAKGLRSPKKSNIKKDDEKDLKNLRKIDLIDFAKDQVPEAMELSSTTTVHENYNLRFSKPSTSWHNTAFKPSSEPHHENVKRIHEDFVLENAVVNNIFAQDYKTFPEATEATSTSHPRLKLKTTQLNVLLNKWTPPPLGSSMASCRPPSLRCSAQNGMNNTQLSTRDRKLPQLFSSSSCRSSHQRIRSCSSSSPQALSFVKDSMVGEINECSLSELHTATQVYCSSAATLAR